MKRTQRWLVVLTCAVLFLAVGLMAEELSAGESSDWRWIAFDESSAPARPRLALTSADAYQVTLAAVLPGCSARPVTAGDQQYSQLGGDGYGHAAATGLPDLPVLRREVEIPFGATVSLDLISARYTDYRLDELGLTTIYPLQPPVPKIEGVVVPFEIDRAFYAGDATYPETPVALGEVYVVRGHRAQPVEVWPVAYNPSKGILRFYQEITFALRLSGSDMARTQAVAERYASPAFDARLEGQFLNYRQGHPAVRTSTAVGYLIITADDYYDAMLPFASLKSSRGFAVTTVKLSQIPATTNSQIKGYIQNAYDNWPIPPSYILLVGDTNTLPGWNSVSAGEVTDLYYATMDGAADWHPDIGRGRFPVRSPAQTVSLVDKYLAYANLTGQEPWVKKAAFVATCDRWQLAEGTHNTVIDNYTGPQGYTGSFPNPNQPGGDKLYCVTYDAGLADMQSAFNEGRVMIIYSGHGAHTGWEVGGYSQSDVRALTSMGVFPFVASHACITADYDLTEVFGETWVLEPGKGALVFWGSSDSSYWDEDDVLEQVMFDSLFAAGRAPVDVATMTDDGLAGVEAAYPGSARYYWETYNILGDPAVKVFREPDLPTFSLEVTPTNYEICSSGNVTSSVQVGSILNFSNTVYLSAGPLPAGVAATLNPDAAPAPFVAELTLEVAAGAAAGGYPVVITATDLVSSTLEATVHLRVADQIADQVTLTAPADGASNVPMLPTLEWEPAAQASGYELEIATDPGFGEVVYRALVAETSHLPADALDSSTYYYWRVRALNACGASEYTSSFVFSTVALPGDCGPGTVPSEIYSQDFEGGAVGWSHGGSGDTWQLSQARPHGGLYSYHASDVESVSDQQLVSPEIALPAGAQALTLQYWSYQVIEDRADGCYDGAILEISTDGGTSWTQLEAELQTDPYDGPIATSHSNPLGGLDGWCGDPQDWLESVVNLDGYAGQDARLRFRLGTDSSASREGWYLDDLVVQSCVAAGPQARIKLETTVGTDRQSCSVSDLVTLPPEGGEVTYCYRVTNIGDLALGLHDLQDSQLGSLLTGMVHDLEIGEATWMTRTAAVVQTTASQATWTAYNAGPVDVARATDGATVVVSVLPPVLVSPADGTRTNDLPVTLVWQASPSSGAMGYQVVLDGRTYQVGNVTQYAAVGLADGIHTWSVAALDLLGYESGYPPAWQFQLDTTPPSPPVLISPAQGWSSNQNHPSLIWSASTAPDLAGYWLRWNGAAIDVGNATQFDPGVLGDGVYSWTVAAYDDLGNASAYASSRTFRIDTTAPTGPTPLSPADVALINYNNPHLFWGTSPSPDASGYRLNWNGAIIDLGEATHYAPGILSDGIYVWSVAAYDEAGNTSPYCAARTLQVDTTPPAIPAPLGPPNGGQLRAGGVTLSWQAPGDNDLAGYRLKWNSAIIDVGNNTQYGMVDLKPGSYVWSVAAYDEAGNQSGYSASWQFRLLHRLFLPITVR